MLHVTYYMIFLAHTRTFVLQLPRMADEPTKKESWIDFFRFAVIAALIVAPIRLFIAQPFVVSGASMAPTFDSGNYLIIDELSYRFEEPKRGDVVVFRFPFEPSKFLIKRIAGLPNETIDIQNSAIRIINSANPEGFVWKEGVVLENGRTAEQHLTLKEDEYFVLGDNRGESADSRLWGPLKKKFIIGRPVIRLLPLKQADIFPGEWKTADGESE